MTNHVDVIVLSRGASELSEVVRRGISAQQGVSLTLHRVIGSPSAGDTNRWATIARARNLGKRCGSAPWVLFVDDDVILDSGCVWELLEALRGRPSFAALAADYLGEMAAQPATWDYPWHVAMGATLFRRDRLVLVNFRWEPGKCECRCACDDLRRAGFGVGYLPEAKARHQQNGSSAAHSLDRPATQPFGAASAWHHLPGRVLTAFDEHHFLRFRRQFLGTLRAAGNREQVTAVAYGLYSSQRGALEMAPGVEVVGVTDNGVHPAIRRLRDFQSVLARWDPNTPVAYWDAGDIIFQASLAPLWELVRSNPGRLLAVREPTGYPQNLAIGEWTETINDRRARRRAFELFSTRPFLNSGFVAGTARVLLRFLRETDRILHSSALRGTSDWGDQSALNLYCHTHPEAWRELPDTWNYCLFGRSRSEFRIGPGWRIDRRDGTPVFVVHGNAKQLLHTELSFTV